MSKIDGGGVSLLQSSQIFHNLSLMTTQQIEEATRPLENRIAILETELMAIKQFMNRSNPGWESIFGSFANCPEFDEMEAFGKAWRSAQNQAPELE
jgi:hypothetical protein